MLRKLSIFISLCLFTLNVYAETVYVKYRGSVDLSPFECNDIYRSSYINRLCYDQNEQYVIVKLNSTYYHYCGVPTLITSSWLSASSMGRFYNSNIKGSYDCRVNYMPSYKN